MPGSPTTPDLRGARSNASRRVAFRLRKNVGVRDKIFSGLDGWPAHSPADASPPPLRATAHGLGPMWIATPSSYRTCTDYSLPVSRRTAKHSVRHLSIRRRPQAEQSAPEEPRVFFVDLDKLDEVFNSEVRKRHNAIFSDAIDPDDAVLGIHFVGDVMQPVFVFAEVLRDLRRDEPC